jgi:hypothetical protein
MSTPYCPDPWTIGRLTRFHGNDGMTIRPPELAGLRACSINPMTSRQPAAAETWPLGGEHGQTTHRI